MQKVRRFKKGALRKLKLFALVALLFFSFLNIAYAQNYEIQPEKIVKRVKLGDFAEIPVTISNNEESTISLTFSLEGMAASMINLNKQSLVIDPASSDEVKLTIFGENISTYTGSLVVSGDISEKIPVNITVTDIDTVPVEALLLEIEPISEKAKIGDTFNFKVGIQNLLSDKTYNVTLK